ncbi:MAG: hypothetical protein MZV70_34455 [Desulfobacterales bacterium]|nr:hypothetical protein [Desulfobacterales bacterium]
MIDREDPGHQTTYGEVHLRAAGARLRHHPRELRCGAILLSSHPGGGHRLRADSTGSCTSSPPSPASRRT